MALRALRRNVMRSLLTCLGIIIGIAAVIAMMEIGRGSSHSIEKSIASLGSNVIQMDPVGRGRDPQELQRHPLGCAQCGLPRAGHLRQ